MECPQRGDETRENGSADGQLPSDTRLNLKPVCGCVIQAKNVGEKELKKKIYFILGETDKQVNLTSWSTFIIVISSELSHCHYHQWDEFAH